MKLSFFGGAEQVTGANHLLETDHVRVLVDCGLFQCPQFCSLENYLGFKYAPSEISALFVTHAHIDHTGRIPKLIREGFGGRIYSTPPTKAFSKIMLEDSIGVLEKEATNESRELYYNLEDVDRAMKVWDEIAYDRTVEVGDLSITTRNASHVLGSAMYSMHHGDQHVLFTGDLGNLPNPLLPDYEKPEGVTHLIIESAYGDREHEEEHERQSKLERAIEDIVHRGGTLMIPAFALERTQQLLYQIDELVDGGRIPPIQVFLDSPLSIKATDIYRKFSSYFNSNAKQHLLHDMDLFKFPRLTLTMTSEESRHIADVKGPKIIIAGAGMMHGGRILHHAKRYLPDRNSMILFVGYLGAGSLGRRILEGVHEVRIHGERVPVRAEVRSISAYSAHADHTQLMEFINSTRDTLEHVYVVQGELKASLFLSQRIKDYLGIASTVPKFGESFEI